jgi:hypothetical protein
MITGYYEFLLERRIESLNEAVVRFSDKFSDLLRMIDSPIASALLSKTAEDHPVKANYFDLSKDGDHLSFLTDAKARQLSGTTTKVVVTTPSPVVSYYYSDLLKEMGLERPNLRIPEEGDVGVVVGQTTWKGKDYLRLALDLDQAPQGPGCVILKSFTTPSEDDMWTKSRQDIRVGRGVRVLSTALGLEFTDSQVEDFVNKFRANYERANDAFRNFEVIKGPEIAKLYHENMYQDPERGDLGTSCMKAKPEWFFEIYTKNPGVCKLVVLRSSTDPKKIVGRALLWRLKTPDIAFMDRIYTNTPAQMQLFREYAKANGTWHKAANNNSTSGHIVDPTGKEVRVDKLEVEIDNLKYKAYPYMDTLRYLSDGSGKATLSNEESDGCRSLDDTMGRWSEEDGCDTCGGSGREGCDDCAGTGTMDCWQCGGDGRMSCSNCDGDGYTDSGRCVSCGRSGEVDCDECDGAGQNECPRCAGDGWLDCADCG